MFYGIVAKYLKDFLWNFDDVFAVQKHLFNKICKWLITSKLSEPKILITSINIVGRKI
jgi:hypothetical protein